MNDKFVQIMVNLDEGMASAIKDGHKVYVTKKGPSEHAYTTLEMATAVAKKVGVDPKKIKKDGDMYTFTEAKELGEYYVEYDDDYGMYCVWHTDKHNGKPYFCDYSKDVAEKRANKLNKEQNESLDEGRGRPKKVVDQDAPPKEKGKRGRPKKDDSVFKDDDDDDSGEGIRNLKMFAHVKSGKKETTDSKEIKGAKPDQIKKLVQDFENQLTVKYANKWDVDEDSIHIHIKDSLGWTGAKAEHQTKDDSGSDAEDDEYSVGKK